MSNPTQSEEAETGTSTATTGHDSHAEDIDEQVRVYVIVFAALAALTVLTVAVAYVELAFVPALIVGLLIATVKGGLVAGYFMHLISEKKVIYVILVFTIVFMIGMIVLTSSSVAVHRGGPGVP